MSNEKYIHDEVHHNINSPLIIVPYIIEKLKPKSVVDVGCGIGTFLKVFNDFGVKDYLGIDGEWVNIQLLNKYIEENNFKVLNLEEEFQLERKFDLAISLEVAEHLKPDSADIFVRNLVKLSDVIVFSAAFPGQGGQNHLNEQWPTYWAEKFNQHGYAFLDYLRPVFWNNKDIYSWYKQNMFLVVKNQKEEVADLFSQIVPVINYIHPDYYNSSLQLIDKKSSYESEYENLVKGRAGFVIYIKMIIKSLLVALKFRK